MSERAHAAAFKAAINTALGAPADDPQRGAYDYGELPKRSGATTLPLPAIYCLISLSRRFGGDARLAGNVSRKGYRLDVQCVGRTVREAQWAREKVTQALDEKRIAALGDEFVKFENESAIEPDDGRYSGLTQFTYAVKS